MWNLENTETRENQSIIEIGNRYENVEICNSGKY